MEIAKDRTTQATVETCARDMFELNLCPQHVTVSQEFIRRSLNEPCPKMVNMLARRFIHNTTGLQSRHSVKYYCLFVCLSVCLRVCDSVKKEGKGELFCYSAPK